MSTYYADVTRVRGVREVGGFGLPMMLNERKVPRREPTHGRCATAAMAATESSCLSLIRTLHHFNVLA